MKGFCSNELMPVKIAFFSSVASVLDPFFRRFQTNAPMGPFLYAEILNIIKTLMKCFIKKGINVSGML